MPGVLPAAFLCRADLCRKHGRSRHSCRLERISYILLRALLQYSSCTTVVYIYVIHGNKLKLANQGRYRDGHDGIVNDDGITCCTFSYYSALSVTPETAVCQ